MAGIATFSVEDVVGPSFLCALCCADWTLPACRAPPEAPVGTTRVFVLLQAGQGLMVARVPLPFGCSPAALRIDLFENWLEQNSANRIVRFKTNLAPERSLVLS